MDIKKLLVALRTAPTYSRFRELLRAHGDRLRREGHSLELFQIANACFPCYMLDIGFREDALLLQENRLLAGKPGTQAAGAAP